MAHPNYLKDSYDSGAENQIIHRKIRKGTKETLVQSRDGSGQQASESCSERVTVGGMQVETSEGRGSRLLGWPHPETDSAAGREWQEGSLAHCCRDLDGYSDWGQSRGSS